MTLHQQLSILKFPVSKIKKVPAGLGQYNGQGVYGGLSTASEVFLIFTTQRYHIYAIIGLLQYFYKREVLQQEYSQPPIISFPHFRWVVKSYILTL